MAPTYDYHCDPCDQTTELFFTIKDKPDIIHCPSCASVLRQVPAIGCIQGEEAAWLESVKDVVNKEGGDHCQRFLQSPTRSNWKRWMEGEKIRPVEPGEKPQLRPDKVDRKSLTRKAYEQHRKHKAISL